LTHRVTSLNPITATLSPAYRFFTAAIAVYKFNS
jgi:hypothetical protein